MTATVLANRANRNVWARSIAAAMTALMLTGATASALDAVAAEPATTPVQLTWKTVVNNNDLIPGTDKTFNSYNQPSINNRGLVVFRARGRGPNEPPRGIFSREMATSGQPIQVITTVGAIVPDPNNLDATFNEFPAFPRIDLRSKTVAFRGQSTPVWQTTIDGLDTRLGTSGIFTNPGGTLLTASAQLGALVAFPCFQVPLATSGPTAVKFDQFPGSPAVAGAARIVFKGNYTVDSVGKTGIFYRLASAEVPVPCGSPAVQLIAGSDTRIPGSSITFGSTAPPSAAADKLVFYGSDNEDSPTVGGLYLAPLKPKPALTTLVRIGQAVPGVPGQVFNRFGEGLSYDGRYLGFWGAWGTASRTVRLTCPADGNAAVRKACNDQCPGGVCERSVPVNQGIFVRDTVLNSTRLVARTGSLFDDFLFWVFSGRPPGVGGGDEGDVEPPRWRSSAFVASAAYSADQSRYNVAFKAAKGTVSGLYLTRGPNNPLTRYLTVADTTTAGQVIDPEAPAGSTVIALGLEREGLRRNNWLAITATMLNSTTTEGIAGIYVTKTPATLP